MEILTDSAKSEIRKLCAEIIHTSSSLLKSDLILGECTIFKTDKEWVENFMKCIGYRTEEAIDILRKNQEGKNA
jgi:hypothetical protein